MGKYYIGQKVKIGEDSSTYGRILEIKGWLFKKYYCVYWGEINGRRTDPSYGVYSRWCKGSELKEGL